MGANEAQEDQIALNIFKTRFPTRQEALPVFSILVFFVFSWTLYRVFWYIPSWLGYLSIMSVVIIIAYALAFALIESAFMLSLVVFFSLFFPSRIMKDKYVAQGSSLAFLLSLGAVMLQRKINLVYRLQLWELIVYPLVGLLAILLLAALLSILYERFPFLLRLVNSVAERMTVFVYIYTPLGILGLIVVLIRNIFRF